MSAEFQQSHHFTLVPDDTTLIDRARANHPSNVSRWVSIGGQAFEVTPQTRYTHILANGRPYYPFYDPTLPTIDPPDYPNPSAYNDDDCSPALSYRQ
jgi:hypothetical protein